jgi:NAD(P)-dependent dehydrogenase (short-subunit alcohol dehydrogenase family)
MKIPDLSLRGKRALVTGGGTGLGQHFARMLADAGAEVVVGGRRERELAETVALISEAGGRASHVILDIADEPMTVATLQRLHSDIGLVDILVNNAGTTAVERAERHSTESWDRVIDTNLRGAFIVAREIARHLIEATRPGSIINVSSILASGTEAGLAAYMASKAALEHLTRGLALEWAPHGIRVNALAPGYFDTELTRELLVSRRGKAIILGNPMGRPGRVEELTVPLLLLAGDSGSYVTGSILTVDGGQLVRPI